MTMLIKIFSIILTFLITVIVLLAVLGAMSRTKSAPGLNDGKLSPCPDKPNCVCSEYKNHERHYITPITLTLPAKKFSNLKQQLKNVVQEMGGQIHLEKDNYIAATFTSAIFGFVDDFEIRLDLAGHIIHLRSSSRVGHGDMGINQKRIRQFKQLYSKKYHYTENNL